MCFINKTYNRIPLGLDNCLYCFSLLTVFLEYLECLILSTRKLEADL